MAPSSLETRVSKVKSRKREDGMVRAAAPPNRHGFSGPSTNKRKSRKPTGSQRAASPPLPPSTSQVHSFRAASQPADSCSASLRSPQTHLLAAARGERFSSFFFRALQWWWWPAVQPLSPPAGWLPTSPRDGCHRTRAPEQLSHPSVPLPTGYSDAERRGVPKQIAAAGWWCSRSSGPVGLFDCSERRDRPGKAGKTRVFGVHTCCVVIIVEGRTHHPPPGSPEDAGGDWTY